MAYRVQRRVRRRSRDGAGTEILGTLLIFGLTVALGSVLAVAAWNAIDLEEPTPSAVFDLAVRPGNATLTRVGGDVLDMAALRIEWVVDGDVLPDALATKSGDPARWNVGEAKHLKDPAITNASTVEAKVYFGKENVLLGALTKRLGTTIASAPGGPVIPALATLDVKADGLTANRFAVPVAHPLGLSYVSQVTLNLSSVSGLREYPLRDDGTRGDLVAGDGIFSVEAALTPFPAAGLYSREAAITAKDMEGRVATAFLPLRVESASPVVQPVYQNTTYYQNQTVVQNQTQYNNVTYYRNVTYGECTSSCKLAAKVTTGTSLKGVPASTGPDGIGTMRLSNITWDKAVVNNAGGDVVTLRVMDDNGTVWTATLTFGSPAPKSNIPVLKFLKLRYSNLWSNAPESTTGDCTPVGGDVTLARNLTIDLLNPTAPGKPSDVRWVCPNGNTAGHYRYANMLDPAVMTVAKIGDPTNEANTAILNADIAYG